MKGQQSIQVSSLPRNLDKVTTKKKKKKTNLTNSTEQHNKLPSYPQSIEQKYYIPSLFVINSK